MTWSNRQELSAFLKTMLKVGMISVENTETEETEGQTLLKGVRTLDRSTNLDLLGDFSSCQLSETWSHLIH